MKGPLHAIRRRRAERPANGVDTAQAATEAPTEAQPTAGLVVDLRLRLPPTRRRRPPSCGSDRPEQPRRAEVPAGQEPVPDRPSFRQRGRLRRRLRYLRRVRELGFRDLGGLVFDQHRFSQVNERARRTASSHALVAVDGELRALEHALDDRRPLTELREPGISVCSRCGALHGSEARFCPSCGTPVHGPRAIAEVGEAVSLPAGERRAAAAAGHAAAPGTAPRAGAAAACSRWRRAAEPAPPRPPSRRARSPHRRRTRRRPTASSRPRSCARSTSEPRRRRAGDGDAEAVAQPTGERREP